MELKFLLDENIPTKLLWWLIGQGFEVRTVKELGLNGKTDQQLYDYCERGGWMLISLDLDFADTVMYPLTFPRIVLRPGEIDPELMRDMLEDVMDLGLPTDGELFVVQPDGFARYGDLQTPLL